MKTLLAAAIGLLLLAASASPAARADEAFARDSLRLNDVQWKAAHNSIDREETLAAQLDWSASEPHQGGCRGIELDLVLDPTRLGPGEEWVFGVQHGGAYRPETPKLKDCLQQVRRWADAHPRHDVVAIHLDLKAEATLGDDAVFAAKIDAILARELGRERFFTPAMLKRGAPTLLAAAQKHGWPTLGELRGKFIAVFSGGDADEPVARRRRVYAATEPESRLCFVDLDQRAAGPSGEDECDAANPYYNGGSRVFINIQLGRKDWERLARTARERGFITREWKANDEASWRKAAAAGVHILSTDRIRGASWAKAGPEPFARLPAAK